MSQKLQLHPTESGLCFDLDLEPDRRLYCFIGENGVGKTALLESWAQATWSQHVVWGVVAKVPSLASRLDKLTLYVPGIESGSPRVPVLGLGTARLAVSGLLRGDESRPVIVVSAVHRASLENIGVEALRLVGDTTSVFGDALMRSLDATRREAPVAASVSAWIAARMLVNREFVTGLRSHEAEVLTLLRLLRDFDPAHFGAVLDDSVTPPRAAITFKDGRLLFMGRPIDRMASGYAALLRVLQEIVAGLSAWTAFPACAGDAGPAEILTSRALIFIDELDAHLHLRWQRHLLPFLKRSFPNATFVVTTHSPLLVRDTDAGEAYELVREGERVTARVLGSPRDWYFSDVLSEGFHVDLPVPGTENGSMPKLVDQLLELSTRVKSYLRSKDPSERAAALTLRDAVLPRLPADDPRRRSVNSLVELLG